MSPINLCLVMYARSPSGTKRTDIIRFVPVEQQAEAGWYRPVCREIAPCAPVFRPVVQHVTEPRSRLIMLIHQRDLQMMLDKHCLERAVAMSIVTVQQGCCTF